MIPDRSKSFRSRAPSERHYPKHPLAARICGMKSEQTASCLNLVNLPAIRRRNLSSRMFTPFQNGLLGIVAALPLSISID
jgi:hypothetical protein